MQQDRIDLLNGDKPMTMKIAADGTKYELVEPKLGRCTCGHTGNTENSQHAGRFQFGHGPCMMAGCTCEQFTWVGYVEDES